MYDHDNLLLDSGHLAHRVEYPCYGKILQRQHARVQAFSDEWPVHDNHNLLPDLGHILKGLKTAKSASTEAGARQTKTTNQREELRYGIQTLLD